MDKNMQVKIDILPVIFGLKRKEYLFIMTILFHNINNNNDNTTTLY